MEKHESEIPILVASYSFIAALCVANTAVSPAFLFDARYAASGITPEAWAAYEASGLSALFALRTQTLVIDTDGDGIPNWWEARFSRSGSKTGLLADSDSDGDGMTAYDEFVAYTDPTNSASLFTISIDADAASTVPVRANRSARRSAAALEPQHGFAISWQSAKGRQYHIFATESLAAGWDDEPIATVEGTGERISFPVEQVGSSGFFRVTVELIP